MFETPMFRRTVLVGAAAAAWLPMQQAVAQTQRANGDWMAMVKAHHQLIAKTFEEVVSAGNQPPAVRKRLLEKLTYQLTAHSVAEENVLYPALADAGMVPESDKLYLDQAHAKVMNSQVQMMALHEKGNAGWLDKARELQAAVLKHATQDEEADLYPKLQQKLDAAKNATLTAMYRAQFESVKPAKA